MALSFWMEKFVKFPNCSKCYVKVYRCKEEGSRPTNIYAFISTTCTAVSVLLSSTFCLWQKATSCPQTHFLSDRGCFWGHLTQKADKPVLFVLVIIPENHDRTLAGNLLSVHSEESVPSASKPGWDTGTPGQAVLHPPIPQGWGPEAGCGWQ